MEEINAQLMLQYPVEVEFLVDTKNLLKLRIQNASINNIQKIDLLKVNYKINLYLFICRFISIIKSH